VKIVVHNGKKTMLYYGTQINEFVQRAMKETTFWKRLGDATEI